MPPKKKPYSQLSESAKHYRDNKASRDKKKDYDTRTQSDNKSKAKRAELERKRYKARKDGKNIDGKDYDHATRRFVSQETNRGRRGEGGRKKK